MNADSPLELVPIFDVVRFFATIPAAIGSRLADRDRDDLERIDNDIGDFLQCVADMRERERSREGVTGICDSVKAQFANAEIDITPAIDGMRDELLQRMDKQEAAWREEYLSISPNSMTLRELDKWKRESRPFPGYIGNETRAAYAAMSETVERALSAKRVDYILYLFEGLTSSEKAACAERIGAADR